MSSCCPPTANAQLSGDPTGTLPIRRDFIRDVARRARDLRGRIRRKVGYNTDAPHLRQDAPGSQLTPNQDDEEPFEFVTEEDLKRKFSRWLQEQIDEALADPVTRAQVLNGEHWTAPYVDSAYVRGWQQATGRLAQQGVAVDTTTDIAAVLDLPVPERQLRQLYSRAFEDLTGITDDMAQQIRSDLTRGLAEGWNPRKTARVMNESVDELTQTRLKTLARTETINAHSEATLDRYERANQQLVVHGEWSTAGDRRVCPICESLEGKVMTVQEMRQGTFSFDAAGDDVADSLAGTYALKPPAHPNGRCGILPVVQGANAVVANSKLDASEGVRKLAS